MDDNSIDTGDQPFNRRLARRRPIMVSEPEGVEDTEGHAVRTYPSVAADDLDCRMPLPGEEDERLRRL